MTANFLAAPGLLEEWRLHEGAESGVFTDCFCDARVPGWMAFRAGTGASVMFIGISSSTVFIFLKNQDAEKMILISTTINRGDKTHRDCNLSSATAIWTLKT